MRILGLSFLLCLTAAATAEVRLPHVLSDHAVLQREQPVRIWGWGAAHENVSVTFHTQTASAQADAYGWWQVWLRPEKAGGPYSLTVAGDATATPVVRTDVLVGDVWLASGQSNMDMPLAGFGDNARVLNGDKEIAAATRPNLRLLQQRRTSSPLPLADGTDVWRICTPETVAKFSAVAYFFGRKVSEEEKVPIGLIDTAWGGTLVQAWISAEGIAWGGLQSESAEIAMTVRDTGHAAAIRAEFAAEDAADKAAGRTPAKHPSIAGDRSSAIPSALYNGMIAPYVGYTIKGVIWYQGESDAETPQRALVYPRAFQTMVQDWRKQWGEGRLPFLYVQLSSWGGGIVWGNVRDAQRRALELADTGMTVTLDVGDAGNIHPADKLTVGNRLAQSALGVVYGEKIEGASPLFERATVEGSSIRTWFSHADGLKSSDAVIGEFEVAGADHQFVAATAQIEKVGDRTTVVAHAESVASPLYVRYGWSAMVKSYLYNGGGLPMGTFTSESDEWLLLH